MPNVTASPTRDKLDGTQRHTRRGNRTRFNKQERANRNNVCVESVTQDIMFKVIGTRESRNDLGNDGCRHPVVPEIEIVSSRIVKRGGKRRFKQAIAAGALWLGKVHRTPAFATEIVRKIGTGVDKDGCAELRIKDYVFGRKNIHTVDAPLAVLADRAAEVVPNDGYTIDSKFTLHKIGKTRFHTATVRCRNGKWVKVITLRRVRNVAEAKVALFTIHGIK